jgi:hypothetical protein
MSASISYEGVQGDEPPQLNDGLATIGSHPRPSSIDNTNRNGAALNAAGEDIDHAQFIRPENRQNSEPQPQNTNTETTNESETYVPINEQDGAELNNKLVGIYNDPNLTEYEKKNIREITDNLRRGTKNNITHNQWVIAARSLGEAEPQNPDTKVELDEMKAILLNNNEQIAKLTATLAQLVEQQSNTANQNFEAELAQMKRENDKKIAEMQKALDEANKKIAELEAKKPKPETTQAQTVAAATKPKNTKQDTNNETELDDTAFLQNAQIALQNSFGSGADTTKLASAIKRASENGLDPFTRAEINKEIELLDKKPEENNISSNNEIIPNDRQQPPIFIPDGKFRAPESEDESGYEITPSGEYRKKSSRTEGLNIEDQVADVLNEQEQNPTDYKATMVSNIQNIRQLSEQIGYSLSTDEQDRLEKIQGSVENKTIDDETARLAAAYLDSLRDKIQTSGSTNS